MPGPGTKAGKGSGREGWGLWGTWALRADLCVLLFHVWYGCCHASLYYASASVLGPRVTVEIE